MFTPNVMNDSNFLIYLPFPCSGNHVGENSDICSSGVFTYIIGEHLSLVFVTISPLVNVLNSSMLCFFCSSLTSTFEL